MIYAILVNSQTHTQSFWLFMLFVTVEWLGKVPWQQGAWPLEQ